ncbi:chemotaxis protein [Lysobacter sp. S4-A87]|uniref:chemotaxis protein CheB n=1 Tax=Lysobacter sp. S4-A87 TaxID=2925843 RepID=UPI001F534867|nr:chemotaxis protein CheB [Lysobacter sp. S4-A87]UNK49054.1 chemotaxis protein [Lysobacter sp. S4-A87]
MSESSRRAVLLARPGAACERLRSALSDAGAQLVLEADPTTLDLSTLGLAAPQVIVVALDAATEDAIERFDPVLADPAVEVIYEEAALAAAREGWDLARWTRHLAAKLQGHGDVLPPGHEPEGEGDFAVDAQEVPAPTQVAAPIAVAAAPEAVPAAPAVLEAPVFEAAVVETAALSPFDPVAAELHYEPSIAATGAPPLMDVQTLDAIEMPLLDEPGMVSTDDAALVIEPFESSFDYEMSPAAAPVAVELLDEVVPEMSRERRAPAQPVLLFDASRPPEIASDDVAPAAPTAAAAAPLAPDWSFAEDNAGNLAGTDSHVANNRFQRDLGDLETRISALELVEDRQTVHNNGAVLVLAGIGGPDAVRQLLGALPETFPRPVLVQQRLDGGRYDRLVAQMQRATPLQVKLAEPGLLAMAGSIYILPAEIAIAVNESGIRFVEGNGDVIASLPSADSAVLLLSGSDPARVDVAMNHSWAGALVAGQAPDGCYDAAASAELIARGGVAGQPVELAERLIARWN